VLFSLGLVEIISLLRVGFLRGVLLANNLASTDNLTGTTNRQNTNKRELTLTQKVALTTCARGDTICLRPCKLTISLYLFARWHLFQHVGYLRHQQKIGPLLNLLTLKVVSESRVTWATYMPILVFLGLCSRVKPDVRDRQTDVRHMSDIPQTSDKSIA